MTKTRTVETIEEFNNEGKLVRKTTTETTEESDATDRWYPYTIPTYDPNQWKVTYVGNGSADYVPTQTTTYSN